MLWRDAGSFALTMSDAPTSRHPAEVVDSLLHFTGEFAFLKNVPAADPVKLLPGELFWRDHQPWLEERGYKLRPRFQPGWVASWKDKVERPRYRQFEDSLYRLVSRISLYCLSVFTDCI